MRRTVRVAGWVLKAVLLAVCLGAAVLWAVGGRAAGRASYVTKAEAAGELRFRGVGLFFADGAAWCGVARLVVTRPHRSWEVAWFGTQFGNGAGWHVDPGPFLRPWEYPAAWWSGTGRCGVLTVPNGVEPVMSAYRAFCAPLWAIALVTGAWPVASLALAGRRRWLRRRAARAGWCPACGYDLRATPGRCPECGLGAGDDAGRAAG